ncbi:MAG: 3-hydroxyacyl-ACP dehydratase FabZ [Eubacteriales bacterium]
MYDINEIKKVIPHREPFLLIDRVIELEKGKKAVAIKSVSYNEYFFRGHFPDNPVMPGVLILEALAQTGAFALLSEEKFKGKIAYFGGMKSVKFKKMVIPGDTLKLVTEIVKIKGSIGIGEATAYVEGKIAAKAIMTFAIK